MPKLNLSKTTQKRIETLLKKLLILSENGSAYLLEDSGVSIKFISGENVSSRLIVKTELLYLAKLVFEDVLSGCQISQQIKTLKEKVRQDLRLLEAMGILEDNRIKRQGNSTWHFTLSLWSSDIAENITQFHTQWKQYKKDSFLHRHTPPSHLARNMGRATTKKCCDWGNAPDTPTFYGRTEELATLEQWVVTDRCRLIAIVGMRGVGKTHLSVKLGKGGIGKTDLSLQLAKGIQDEFECVIWRSLINTPCLSELLLDLVKILSNQSEVTLPTDQDQQIACLHKYLKARRSLIILDNVESILSGGDRTEDYGNGYEGYGELFQQVSTRSHQSCVLLTSRQAPHNLKHLAGTGRPVRYLKLSGLDTHSGKKIFETIGNFTGSEQDWQHLIDFYNGNPLALELTAHHIQQIFQGDIAQFLQIGKPIFDDLRELLNWHFDGLTDREKEVLIWLAIEREPVTITALQANIVSPLAIRQLPQTLSSLQSRLPLESSASGFTLQPVLMEYVTEHLIENAYQAILIGNPDNSALNYLYQYALVKATAKDYVRHSQTKLIAQPVLDRLLDRLGSLPQVKRHLERILVASRNGKAASMENRPLPHLGYAAGNIINLLQQLQTDLSGKDFSRLTLRQAYLQGVKLQGCNFAHAHFHQTTFTQPFNSLRSITFSPKGDTLAFGDVFGNIYLQDTVTNTQRHIFQGHTSWVRSLVFSQDGMLLASGSMDNTAKLWVVETGQCIATLTGHLAGIWSVALNSDASMLVSSSMDGTVKCWDLSTHQCVSTLEDHHNAIYAIALHPNNRTLASAGADQQLKLWDLQTGQCQATLTDHQEAVWCLAFSPNGNCLASGSGDRTIKLWDIDTQACTETLVRGKGDIYAVAFSPCGQKLASANQDAAVRIWDLATASCIQTCLHSSWAWSVAFSPDGQQLATASDDQIVRLWDVKTGKCQSVLASYAEMIRDIAFLPPTHNWEYQWPSQTQSVQPLAKSLLPSLEPEDQPTHAWLATAGDAHTLRIWNLNTGEFHRFGEADSAPFGCLSIRKDGKYIAGGRAGDNGKVLLWRLGQEQQLYRRFSHAGWLMTVAFAPHREILVSGSFNGEIKIWDIDNDDCLHCLTAHQSGIWSVEFSPDGTLMASAGIDGSIRIWETQCFKCIDVLRDHQAGVRYIEFSANGQYLISTSLDQTIKLWNVKTRQCVRTFRGHKGVVWVAALSADAQRLVSGEFDGSIKHWNVQTGECISTLKGHRCNIWAIKYSPDGKIIASAGEDETVKLWDAKNGQCLKTIRMPRPYDGMTIKGATGLTQTQKESLYALGVT